MSSKYLILLLGLLEYKKLKQFADRNGIAGDMPREFSSGGLALHDADHEYGSPVLEFSVKIIFTISYATILRISDLLFTESVRQLLE